MNDMIYFDLNGTLKNRKTCLNEMINMKIVYMSYIMQLFFS